jgi:hypothetical protein
MSVKSATVECDRCRTTATRDTNPLAPVSTWPGLIHLPKGWLRFSIFWSDGIATADVPREIDLCPDCMGNLTIAKCMDLRQRGFPPPPPLPQKRYESWTIGEAPA